MTATEAIDPGALSEKQAAFFQAVGERFPGIIPLELQEDGAVVFRGQGSICRINSGGAIETLGEAPDCPNCADNIMRKIDEGHVVAQCDHCGKAMRDLSGGSND
jgi:hypothetical protein